MTEHTIKGVPLAKCTADDLYREYMAGMELEAREGLTVVQEERLLAIEKLLPSTDGETEGK